MAAYNKEDEAEPWRPNLKPAYSKACDQPTLCVDARRAIKFLIF